jgi:hypothetical protein
MTVLVTAPLAPCLALAGVRCGSHIIDKGSSSAEVTAYCGAPAQVDRTPSVVVADSDQPAHQIEIWTYNFGPNMLMQRIQFEDGLVVKIDNLGYGYNDP